MTSKKAPTLRHFADVQPDRQPMTILGQMMEVLNGAQDDWRLNRLYELAGEMEAALLQQQLEASLKGRMG